MRCRAPDCQHEFCWECLADWTPGMLGSRAAHMHRSHCRLYQRQRQPVPVTLRPPTPPRAAARTEPRCCTSAPSQAACCFAVTTCDVVLCGLLVPVAAALCLHRTLCKCEPRRGCTEGAGVLCPLPLTSSLHERATRDRRRVVYSL